jgi:hypothetical protein
MSSAELDERVARYANCYTISGYVPLSLDLIREIEERALGPVHGPPEPMGLRLKRELQGHPVGKYRRVA